MGQSPPSSTYNENGEGLPFFQGKTEFSDLHPIPKKWCSKPKKIAEKNDILISVRAPVGTTNIADQKCCIGRGLAAVRYPDCPKYLFYFFRSIEKELDSLGTGTTFKAISASTLKNLEVTLPPLPEQHQIVEKIEELFSELDNGIDNLKKAKAQIKTYRQAVLKFAFEGKLTAEDISETANVKREKGELPEGWEWEKLGEVLDDIRYGTSKKCFYTPQDIPVLRIPNVINGSINKTDLKYSKFSRKEISDLSIKSGDILVIRSNGSLSIVGKSALVSKEDEGLLYAGYLIRLRLKSSIIDSSYLNYCFDSRILRNQIESKAKSTSGVNNINSKELQDLAIPLTDLRTQTQIVEEIEKRFSVADKMEAAIDESLKKSESLRQSILKQAFEGKLV